MSKVMPGGNGKPSFQQVACGLYHTAAVTADGSLYTWGGNRSGQLGQGDTTEYMEPKLVKIFPPGKKSSKRGRATTEKFKQVAAGLSHTVALSEKGLTYCWGSGADGKTGHGNEEDALTPKVCEGLRKRTVSLVACGADHSAAVTDGGELFTFGVGSYGNLGHGSNSSAAAPKVVDALLGKIVTDVACGGKHTICVTREGEMFVFGYGGEGRLGLPDSLGSFLPASINLAYPDLRGKHWTHCFAGESHSMALTDQGELFTWGAGDYGKLGHGDSVNLMKPKIVDQFRNVAVVSAAAGAFHSFALTDTGDLYSWGGGSYGKLGQSDMANKMLPRKIKGLNVSEVTTSTFHSAALSSSGDLYAWGFGGNGRLGNNNSATFPYPEVVRKLKTKMVIKEALLDITDESGGDKRKRDPTLKEVMAPKQIDKIACGGLHTVVGSDNGMIFVYGDGHSGQLGWPFPVTHGDHKELKQAKYLASVQEVRQIVCGAKSTMVLTTHGRVFSWGCGDDGRLGHGDTTTQQLPRKVVTLNPFTITFIAAGDDHAAAVTNSGILFTWGSGASSKLGHDSSASEQTPTQVKRLADVPIAKVACGGAHTVGISKAGQLWSWGGGWKGKLGHGDQENRTLPTLINSMKRKRFVDVACGTFHTVAVTDKGLVFVWGLNSVGQLGLGDMEPRLNPEIVEELREVTIDNVEAGEAHTLFLSTDNRLFATGGNQYGQLGVNNTDDQDLPRVVDGLNTEKVVTIACGANHSGAVTRYGTTYMWGNASNHRLGIETDGLVTRPGKVTSLRSALGQSGDVSPELLDELRGTDISLGTTATMLDRTKQISKRIGEKHKRNMRVDIQEEIESTLTGLESESDTQSLIMVMAASLASGFSPPTLQVLQQVVKSEKIDLEDELVTKTEMRAAKCEDLDVIVRNNYAIELRSFDTEAKIKMTLQNIHDLQRVLAESAGLKLDDVWTPEDERELPLVGFGELVVKIYEMPETIYQMIIAEEERDDQDHLTRALFNGVFNACERHDFNLTMNAYGKGVSCRDEHAVLKTITLAIAHEMSSNPTGEEAMRTIIDPESNLSLLLSHYSKRPHIQLSVRNMLAGPLQHLLERENNFELNPVTIMVELQHQRGGKIKPGDITDEKAWKDKMVMAERDRRIDSVLRISDQLLNEIMKRAAKLPYGMRLVCKELYALARDKLPLDKDDGDFKLASAVNTLIFDRILIPCIITPYQFKIIDQPPTGANSQTLVEIGKILHLCATGEMLPDREHKTQINKFVRKNKDVMVQYTKTITDVVDLDSTHMSMRYLATAEELDPVLRMPINDLSLLHTITLRQFRDGKLEGNQKEWGRIMAKLGAPAGQVPESLNEIVTIRTRLSERVLWPENITSKGGGGAATKNFFVQDVKTELVMALKDLPVLTAKTSGSLEKNLEEARREALVAEKFKTADKLTHVIEYVKNMSTADEEHNKEQGEKLIRAAASQISFLRRQLFVMRADLTRLNNIEKYLIAHEGRLQEMLDQELSYLKNIRKVKLTDKNLKMAKRKKNTDDEPFSKKKADQEAKEKANNAKLSVKRVLTDEMRKIAPRDLQDYIDQRPGLTKLELAEEVEVNTEWRKVFDREPSLNALRGRASTIESLLDNNPEVNKLLKENVEFKKIILENTDLRRTEFQELLLSDLELKEFVDDNQELKDMLNARMDALEEEKQLRDENPELLDCGPVVELKYQDLKDDGIIIAIVLPDRVLKGLVVQFASATPGEVSVLFKEKPKKSKKTFAHVSFSTSMASLLDMQKDETKVADFGKVRFSVDGFINFMNTELRW